MPIGSLTGQGHEQLAGADEAESTAAPRIGRRLAQEPSAREASKVVGREGCVRGAGMGARARRRPLDGHGGKCGTDARHRSARATTGATGGRTGAGPEW